MILINTFIVLLLLINPVSDANAGKDWQLKTNKNGILVYTKSVPGSDVDAVKSVYSVNCSLSTVVTLFADVSTYPQWIYRCIHARILTTISPTDLVYYQETSVPWPASNRDLIGHIQIRQDQKTGTVTISAENMPQFIPEKPGIVRLKTFHEIITIIPKGNHAALVSYELFLDPGGSIPAWMVNLASVDGPYESSLAMIKLIDAGEFKNAHLPYIKEP